MFNIEYIYMLIYTIYYVIQYFTLYYITPGYMIIRRN